MSESEILAELKAIRRLLFTLRILLCLHGCLLVSFAYAYGSPNSSFLTIAALSLAGMLMISLKR